MTIMQESQGMAGGRCDCRQQDGEGRAVVSVIRYVSGGCIG